MKKITARNFQRLFAKADKGLKPGESLEVTRRGKPAGRYIKEGIKPISLKPILDHLPKSPITGPKVERLLKEITG